MYRYVAYQVIHTHITYPHTHTHAQLNNPKFNVSLYPVIHSDRFPLPFKPSNQISHFNVNKLYNYTPPRTCIFLSLLFQSLPPRLSQSVVAQVELCMKNS